MTTQVSAIQNTLGANEKVFYAQQIIDAFTKSIDAGMCLSKIPIAIISQIDIYQNNLNDILKSLGNDTPDSSIKFITPKEVSQTIVEINIPADEPDPANGDPLIVSSLLNKFNQECIPCGVNFPKLDLDSIFKGLLAQIQLFIDFLEGLIKNLTPSYCHFAYFLSFICIPDIARILATIIARILQLLSNIVLGSISVAGFIAGILGHILSTLTDYALSLVNFVASPITCLIESISELIEKLPTQGSINRKLTDEEYFRIYGVHRTPGSQDPALNSYEKKLDDSFAQIRSIIYNEFSQARDVIGKASDGVQQTFQDLFGLKNFMECENERTGNNLFEKVQDIMELIQMANLLASLLKKKVNKATVDELCRYKGQNIQDNTTNPINISDIADIIDDINGGITNIIQDNDGNDIGIIIDKPHDIDNNLSIWSCNLADFIRDNSLDQIITKVLPIDGGIPIGTNLKDPRVNNKPRTRININNLTKDQKPIIFNDSYLDDTESVIKYINDIFSYNPLQDKNELNYYLINNPKPIDKKIVIASKSNSIKNLSSHIGTKNFIISDIVAGSSITHANEIKCGSIENIKNSLDLILG